jgi:hypothetical protein
MENMTQELAHYREAVQKIKSEAETLKIVND